MDWDTTQNLMIEGDNLEVLKLLQKSYAGKVKLIYIDPPYNTGKDFVYSDDYRDNLQNYLKMTGQVDCENRKLSIKHGILGAIPHCLAEYDVSAVEDGTGPHEGDDGLICISIDDGERDNLRSACDELFGEENFIESIVWKKRYGGGAKEKHLVSLHDYVLVYAQNINELGNLYVPQSQESIQRYYTKRDRNFEKRGPYRTHPLEATKSMG